MLRFLRIVVVVLLLEALAPLAASAATVPGCANPADSAFNQYCETIPSSRGAQTPRPGLPTLGSTLPARVQKQLAGGKTAGSRALLAVPAAPASNRAIGSLPAAVSTSATSSFPVWLIIVLIATALTLGAVAAARYRRRHRPGPQGGATP